MSNIQLTNASVLQQNIQGSYPKPIQSAQCKTMITLVVGIIVALGGLFILLAALRILPHSPATSQLHEIGKIFSPIVIIAGVAAIAYGIYQASQLKKMTDIYGRVTHDLQTNSTVSRDDLAEYLCIQIKDGNFSEMPSLLPKLGDAHAPLFGVAAEEGLMSEMMDQVPKDITRLKIGFGNHLDNFDRACVAADQFASKLNDFTQLEHITLDLSGVAYYTERVRNHAKGMLCLIDTFVDGSFGVQGGEDYIYINGSGYHNNAAAANCAIDGLIKYAKAHPSIVAHILFAGRDWITICSIDSPEGSPQLKLIPGRVLKEKPKSETDTASDS